MALLSRKVDYALLVLSFLTHRPQGGCAREIAERFGLKRAFAANVLKLLCRKGLVRGQRGIHGGYVLARPASDIALGELLELMEEPFQLADCNRPTVEGTCGLEGVCPVRSPLASVDARIREVLAQVRLADLFQAESSAGCTQYGLEVRVRERVPVHPGG